MNKSSMGGMGFLLQSMGIPMEEITGAATQLISLGERIQAQLDRIESRLANLEHALPSRGAFPVDDPEPAESGGFRRLAGPQ